MKVDVLVEKRDQNRAFDGDTVVIQFFPPEKWTQLKDYTTAETAEGDEEVAGSESSDSPSSETSEEDDVPQVEEKDKADSVLVPPQPVVVDQNPKYTPIAIPKELLLESTEVKTQVEVKIEAAQPIKVAQEEVKPQKVVEAVTTVVEVAKVVSTVPQIVGEPVKGADGKIPLPVVPAGIRPTGKVVFITQKAHVEKTFVGFIKLPKVKKKKKKINWEFRRGHRRRKMKNKLHRRRVKEGINRLHRNKLLEEKREIKEGIRIKGSNRLLLKELLVVLLLRHLLNNFQIWLILFLLISVNQYFWFH